jgi:hypothetical protein
MFRSPKAEKPQETPQETREENKKKKNCGNTLEQRATILPKTLEEIKKLK